MANAWGELSWNAGNWGEQSDATVASTGFGLTTSLNSVDSYPNTGWGSDFWGSENWGESTLDVQLTGIGLSINSGESETWGQKTWGATNSEWGGPALTSVAIGQQINLTGQQINFQNLGTPLVFSATEVFLQDNPLPALSISEGTVDAEPDAMVSGQQLSTGLGSLTVYNEQGWGRDRWGTEAWGAEGVWTSVSLTGFDLSVTSGVQETWGQDEWGASTTEWGGNSVTDVDIKTFAAVTGQELTAAEGTVDPSPDATVVGIGLSASLAVGSVIEADANVVISNGFGLTLSQGQAELDAVTFANITGQQLDFALNSAVAGASAEVSPTGVDLTVNLGSVNIQSWQIVDTGSDVTWNIIDTAA